MSRFDLIFGTFILCGLGKKPIVLCVDLMNINEWAGLNAKISRNGSLTRYLNNRRSVWVDILYSATLWPREEAY